MNVYLYLKKCWRLPTPLRKIQVITTVMFVFALIWNGPDLVVLINFSVAVSILLIFGHFYAYSDLFGLNLMVFGGIWFFPAPGISLLPLCLIWRGLVVLRFLLSWFVGFWTILYLLWYFSSEPDRHYGVEGCKGCDIPSYFPSQLFEKFSGKFSSQSR